MSRDAYVTLVTNDAFAVGAGTLLRSLALSGTERERVVLHTGGVGRDTLARLRGTGATLVEIDLLPTSDDFNATHGRARLHGAAAFTRGEKPGFHTPLDNFAKLRVWELDYDRVVFLDADTLVLRNIDRLFEYPELSAAPNVYERLSDFHRMNSGVFTARPSRATYQAMLARLDVPGAFWRRTDQTFLQDFFPDWHGLPVTMNTLQYVWLNLPELWSWESIHVLHFQYEKPWERHAKSDRLRPLIDLWHAYAAGTPPDLSKMPVPCASR